MAMTFIGHAGRDLVERLLAALRTVPGAATFFVTLSLATGILALSDDARRVRLLDASSTNLDRLGHEPLRVLVASALWILPSSFLIWGPLTFAVLATVERRIGTRRMLVVFAVGHAGATLIAALGIWAGIRHGTVDPQIAHALDVGVSYGVYATAAYATGFLPRPRRGLVAGALAVFLAYHAASGRTFTDFGHLFALGLGFTLWLAGFARGRPSRHGRRVALALVVSLVLAGAATAAIELPHPRAAPAPAVHRS